MPWYMNHGPMTCNCQNTNYTKVPFIFSSSCPKVMKKRAKFVIYVLFLAQKYHIVCFTSRFWNLYPSLHFAWCGDLIFLRPLYRPSKKFVGTAYVCRPVKRVTAVLTSVRQTLLPIYTPYQNDALNFPDWENIKKVNNDQKYTSKKVQTSSFIWQLIAARTVALKSFLFLA